MHKIVEKIRNCFSIFENGALMRATVTPVKCLQYAQLVLLPVV